MNEECKKIAKKYFNDISKIEKIIEGKDKEIERLNNIINELEKESYLGMIENTNNNDMSKGLHIAYKYMNNKVKELKGSE